MVFHPLPKSMTLLRSGLAPVQPAGPRILQRFSLGRQQTIGLATLLSTGMLVGCEKLGDPASGTPPDGVGGQTGLDVDPGEGGASSGLGAGSAGSAGGPESGPVCESATGDTELAPIMLAFAFDVSGSMGQNEPPQWWYDPATKWTPVVDATTAFFEGESSEGVSASLRLFPSAGDREDGKCESETYRLPEVPMAELPRFDFKAAFDAYEAEVGDPLAGGGWRGGTPTLPALLGTAEYLHSFRESNPSAQLVVVLVTDGEPQGCESTVESVSEAVAELADTGIRTFVIGIENPTNVPTSLPAGWLDWGDCSGVGGGDTPCYPEGNLSALNAIAEHGGTEEAFLIDTGNPDATKAAFVTAIDAIRERSISCELGIPEHPEPSKSFEKEKIEVKVTLDGKPHQLRYDAECAVEGAWRYDDEDEPSLIVLCPSACQEIQAQSGAELKVEFLCEARPELVK